ncbi:MULTISPECIES: glycine--tRNA ligase subunit beta [unclassified Wenzhouxiangella]|uniref:glycine--tRNA ligase subunit beta n=1 Tax=unclassified Wenzhouxiangella TaxID=2613841 RepID=UPI000E32D149|nr:MULTISPECIES: glycine--tRNA ligase subunit beta [unclassified Wenzhouxiangella]RFF26797.1 glycine--tRNA ligase subunit beta [Wenzhouxiangella sp. 15181]RFP67679.1 glycine--tRNA ligase subunit beta [Wenzhouxiangella sp. 15190]
MSEHADLLIEIGCEELPAGQLQGQVKLLAQGLGSRLVDAGLIDSDDDIAQLGTPRRLAVRIPAVRERQADQVLDRKGPAENVALDADGNPTKAAEGFARSVGKSFDELEWLENDQGRWLFTRVEQPGKSLSELLPEMFDATVRSMAGARSMRWSDRDDRFLRPVRWLLVLHGEATIELEYFGLKADRQTRGHRIHAPGWHAVDSASAYDQVLEKASVIVDPARRRERIVAQAKRLAGESGLMAVLDDALVDEVAGLTEWPVAVMGRFSEDFLEVPEEALISSLEQHQKSFALRDGEGRLAPRFIAVANIESTDPELMTAGFERVIRPRLADARFFWDQDRRNTLADKRDRLDAILFQEKLGSIGDKVRRLERLVETTAPALDANIEISARAAHLCKCDLVTEMVGEFPELQGIMGRYYALSDGEPKAVADAIEGHYRPRHAGDELAHDAAGRALALADRLDTVLGVFAAGQKPRGGKDPFALRRAALGIVRLLADSGTTLTIRKALEAAAQPLEGTVAIDETLVDEVEQFVFERLRSWASEQGMETNTVHAVAAGEAGSVADFLARARAVQQFADDPAMASLVAANKRAGNLLKQAGLQTGQRIDRQLLSEVAESRLAAAIDSTESELDRAMEQADYPAALATLAKLREPVDAFFDEVMVMCDDESLRNNRLALLGHLRALFLRIADVARLGR